MSTWAVFARFWVRRSDSLRAKCSIYSLLFEIPAIDQLMWFSTLSVPNEAATTSEVRPRKRFLTTDQKSRWVVTWHITGKSPLWLWNPKSLSSGLYMTTTMSNNIGFQICLAVLRITVDHKHLSTWQCWQCWQLVFLLGSTIPWFSLIFAFQKLGSHWHLASKRREIPSLSSAKNWSAAFNTSLSSVCWSEALQDLSAAKVLALDLYTYTSIVAVYIYIYNI